MQYSAIDDEAVRDPEQLFLMRVESLENPARRLVAELHVPEGHALIHTYHG